MFSLELFQLAKIGLSVGLVVGLSAIAERSGPRVAGMLAGYPLGVAIALFFIGYEIGPEFAARSAVFTQAGLVSNLCLTAGYLLGLRVPGRAGLLAAGTLGIGAFLLASSLLQWVPGRLPLQFALTLLAIAAFAYAYRKLPERLFERRTMTRQIALARGLIAAAIVVLVTAMAHVLPERWAGLLAGFPFTMFPLLLLMHASHGPAMVVSIIKHYPAGLVSLAIYALAVALCYAPLGIYLGTAVGFALATVYLYAFVRLRSRWPNLFARGM